MKSKKVKNTNITKDIKKYKTKKMKKNNQTNKLPDLFSRTVKISGFI